MATVCISAPARNSITSWIIYRRVYGSAENILPDLCDHVVSLDLPAVTNRSIIEFGMEIFITHQHVQFVTGNIDRDNGMAFLIVSGECEL